MSSIILLFMSLASTTTARVTRSQRNKLHRQICDPVKRYNYCSTCENVYYVGSVKNLDFCNYLVLGCPDGCHSGYAQHMPDTNPLCDTSCLKQNEGLDEQLRQKYEKTFLSEEVLERISTSYSDANVYIAEEMESSVCFCSAATSTALSFVYGSTFVLVFAAIVMLLILKQRHKSKTRRAQHSHLLLLASN